MTSTSTSVKEENSSGKKESNIPKKNDSPKKSVENAKKKSASEKTSEKKRSSAQKVKEEKEKPNKSGGKAKSTEKKKKSSSKKRVRKKKSQKIVLQRGKRKEAIARARIKEGSGTVRVNGMDIEKSIQNKYLLDIMLEPLYLAEDKWKSIDVKVNVKGGGIMGQAQAVRTAIAKAMVEYFEDESLKKTYLERSISLLVEDSRRVEPKKYKGRKARARFQKSYR